MDAESVIVVIVVVFVGVGGYSRRRWFALKCKQVG